MFVLGLAEDLVPGRLGVDALLPDEIRALAGGQLPLARERIERRRRQVQAAFAAGPAVTASYPRGDLRRSTERLPSRWLRSAEAEEKPSYATALATTSELANEQEWRIRMALAGELIDPIERHGREMREARDRAELTRFDGDLSGHRLPDPTGGSVISPTALEAWARCPHAYFLQAPACTPGRVARGTGHHHADRAGQLLPRHAGPVLRRAGGARCGARRSDPWTAAQRADLRRIAVEEAADLTVRAPDRPPPAVAPRADRRAVPAGRLPDRRRAGARGDRPPAGALGAGLRQATAAGRRCPCRRADPLMRGSADRVDRAGDAIVVVDYKTGAADCTPSSPRRPDGRRHEAAAAGLRPGGPGRARPPHAGLGRVLVRAQGPAAASSCR